MLSGESRRSKSLKGYSKRRRQVLTRRTARHTRRRLLLEPLERRRLLTVNLESFDQVPFAFEANAGQTEQSVEFRARNPLFLMSISWPMKPCCH
jgi:hypothetical protein